MLVREIMTRAVCTVQALASPGKAIELMSRRRLTSLPVVDADGEFVGLISEADLLKVDLHQDPRAHMRSTSDSGRLLPPFVQDLMTTGPHTVSEETDVADLAQIFERNSWKSMPVLRSGTLVGMVSRSDVIRSIAVSDAQILTAVTATLQTFENDGWYAVVDEGAVWVSGPSSEQDDSVVAAALGTLRGVRQVQVAPASLDPGSPDASPGVVAESSPS